MKKLYTIAAAAVMSVFSFTANAQNELVSGDHKVGDLITLADGSQWYVGPNEVTNGSFDMDPAENDGKIVGWTLGNYAQMMATTNGGTFIWHKTGGYDGGAYIQANVHNGAGGNGSIGMRWTVEPDTRYYFSFYLAKNSANNQYIPVVSLTSAESTGGGQNETSPNGSMIIGKNGGEGVTDELLGYGAYNNGDWCQTACSFDSKEYTYLQFNARWLKENSIQACFDGFFLAKLYNIDEVTPEQVAIISLEAKKLAAEDFIGDELSEYDGLADAMWVWYDDAEFQGYDETTDLKDIQDAIDEIDAKIAEARAAVAKLAELESLYEVANSLFETTEYPGKDDFEGVLDDINDYVANSYMAPDGEDALAYVTVMYNKLNDAIGAYRSSQEASEENPADYTYLIDNPTFNAQGKWYKGSYTGGDQRLNTNPNGTTLPEGIASCWNAWSNELNSTTAVAISQNLDNIPNGYYTVSALMITQSGLLTNQHLFANSSVASVVSPAMTIDGWDNSEWEKLTTEKILVLDGKLTIGATGCGDSEEKSTRGWFCVTDFKLNYLGPVSDEEMKEAYDAKLAEINAAIDAMHLAGDKAAAQDSLAALDAAESYDAKLAVIAAADAVVTASEAEYNGIMAGTYVALQDSVATEAYSDNAKKVTNKALDIFGNYLASSTATYKETGSMTASLRAYLNNYNPALMAAEEVEINNAEAKSALAGTIAQQVAELAATDTLPSEATLNKYRDNLNATIAQLKKADIEYGADKDVSGFITDAQVSDASKWNVVKVNADGNGVKTSQGYTGDATDGYIDTWNATAGMNRTNIYQTVELPNGVYKLQAQMRTSAPGAYLFASDAAVEKIGTDSVAPTPGSNTVLSHAVVVPTDYNKYVMAGEEAQANTDSYGEIWMQAMDRIMAIAGVEGASEFASALDIVITQYNNDDEETCPEGVDPLDWDIVRANGSKGRGWFNNELTIEVKNHTLTIGVTSDSIFTAGLTDTKGDPCIPFEGTWFSANNFKLTMISEGDNSDWSLVPTGVEAPETEATKKAVKAIYTVAGVKVASIQKGINIIEFTDGSAIKVRK